MVRTLLIGAAVFLVLLVVFAPAGLLRGALPQSGPVQLLALRGSVWQGSGRLLLSGQPLGKLRWRLRPVTILQGRLGYHLQLTGAEADLEGLVAAGTGTSAAELSGRLDAAPVNRELARYDIELSGSFELLDTRLELAGARPTAAGGELRWSGGPVRYRLSGRLWTGTLPPLNGFLGPGPEAVVYPEGGNVPLLRLELLDNGFARIGVTKLLTRLVNNPWPGSDPDDAVVLEVEEQVF